MNPLLFCDYYKTEHFKMYPENMIKLYSNFTPRKSRMKEIDKVVVFGLQHFCLEYLIKKFNLEFFCWKDAVNAPDFGLQGWETDVSQRESTYDKSTRRTIYRYTWDKSNIIKEYSKHINVDTKHIEELWDLGYLPIEIKGLEEGTLCPIGVPCMTITNTHPDFGWLVNYLETLISCSLWQSMTSATIAHEYKKLLIKYAKETDEKNIGFVDWQGHDFSMRGMSSVESAILSGMGHLLSFTGTDTIPAIYQLEQSYNASDLIGASVPATEHSVMCMGTKESEIDTFKRLLKLYPTGILSVVSDTWDLWKVLTKYLPQLKDQILARNGKLVIRPDSGDPVDIICGYKDTGYTHIPNDKPFTEEMNKGVIELLWDVFGGTINEQGYKVLDPHIGAIYGDSITLDGAREICERLKAKGFASTNIVLGIGSYTYQFNTRDTFGFAMKATYGEVLNQCLTNCKTQDCIEGCIHSSVEPREIFKDPITDDGTKKSAKGLLSVNPSPKEDGTIVCRDQCTWDQERNSLLRTVFKDSKLVKETALEEIRKELNEKLRNN